jgi:hypothetical protein
MNYQPEEDLQRRLQQLEAEINSFSPSSSPSKREEQTNLFGFSKFKVFLERSQIWFQNLSGVQKLLVIGVAILLGFSVLQTVFKLVISLISLALLAVLVYFGYKFLVSGSFQRKQ